MILHIDMDAFFASIEQAVNPKLRGRPLIVGSRQRRLHTIVCAASYEAKALGIETGMPTKQAFRICPNLAFVPAEQARYIWTSEQILRLLKGYGFQLYYASIDEFQMDIRNTPQLQTLTKDIQERIRKKFNITASIGIAKNWILAKLGSKINKPRGIAIITESNLAQTLAAIPVEKLCGIGLKSAQFLQAIGIKTCLDLYQKPAHYLGQILGKNGLNFYMTLHSNQRFQEDQDEERPKSIGHSYTFPKASKNTEFIRGWIRLLSEMVAKRLRENNLYARTVNLWINGPEIGNFNSQSSQNQPVNDGYEIFIRCLRIRAKTGQNQPKIRALGVSCSNLCKDKYIPLFKEEERREDLIRAIDQINTRHGENTIFPAIINLTKRM